MKCRLPCLWMIFFCSMVSYGQYIQGFWTFHYPGSQTVVSSFLYPVKEEARPFAAFAINTLPSFGFAGSWHLAYGQPLKALKANLCLGMSAMTFGPYQERSIRLLAGRSFGKEFYAFLQADRQQVGVSGYGQANTWAYASCLAWKYSDWLISFYWHRQIRKEGAGPFLQMAWTYKMNERFAAGFHLKKLPGLAWQSIFDLSFVPDKKQSLHLGVAARHAVMLAYERQQSRLRLRLSILYAAPLGMFPENAFHYSW